ncbi:aspartyl/glutamyl-tRNA(Asn/Gln) amidotransferase subunit A [Luteococcus japonicus]|uniref:Glutamyl-tRNA(Gln) amidotransferase subunit A n=2 Tax=Luteococcus japonicus TaxID=33984 RepID=A0A1R4JLB5_9ACTN|nr:MULTISPECIES: Asp-tRNA(Asn)/Glu-tRNA(Gln) amidotransferase subunit GatA [Luteococcus]MDN5563878.1 Asp-tRNA(Asn)/Glu-tRNA(Gln) amidotransferase subunit GatA [Luteococcus sp.]ROR53043.1 aspartyl/glutamyl-tRNA(Asn/Gln) amidotransferase subunit A [Luteococcus japonicus]SJN32734.1 Aspartyl-tRNA(Asn) amidotransferase subunit A amidotransferase subunit A [Luteococcus japonicus LSP_Lj1]
MSETTDLILHATARQLAAWVRSGEHTSVEVTEAFLDRIDEVDSTVNAFISTNREAALAAARRVDERVAAGEELGPLAGVPIAVKDLLCWNESPTTAGSRILEGWVPPYDATIVQRLLDAGLVIIGKTNLDEFAMGSTGENSAYGATRNPWDSSRIPGGSGSGSAAALAAFEAPLTIGTDTGGSIRQPAALTGTVGVKPTYGGTSRFGVIAMASSLDQPGPCARNVGDAALLHEVICGHDPADSTSLDAPVPAVVEAAELADVAGMRIGIVRELSGEGFSADVRQRFEESVELLKAAGAEVVEVSCPNFGYALGAYYLIMPAEVSSNLSRYDAMRYGLRVGDDGSNGVEQVMRASRAAGFGDEVKRRIILGTYALSSGYYDAYYGSAQKVRTLVQRDFEAAFAECDVLVSPVTTTTAYPLGEKVDDPVAMYAGDLATIPSNLAGIPAGSVPCGLGASDGLPVGFHIMAPAMADDRVYRVGAALEKALEARWGMPLLAMIHDSDAAQEARA